MSISKVIITKGTYLNRELRLLISFDELGKPLDVLNLDITHVGEIHKAKVEKILKDIDSCILKLDNGEKGFIEIKKLIPEAFITRHSLKKNVCQADEFFIQITEDKKYTKPYTCNFIPEISDDNIDFLHYYFSNYCSNDIEIITDLKDIGDFDSPIRIYESNDVSLWNLYDFNKILDGIISSRVYLKSGGNIIIEPTEAMTIVDVNSAQNYGKTNAFDTNLEALTQLARQLRNRSISGIIIVDLLKVSKEQQNELVSFFKDLAKDDISKVSVHGFTKLGLLEITRSRKFSKVILEI